MTYQSEIRLKEKLIYGQIELTIVDDDSGEVTTEQHISFYEAKSAIEFHEHHAEVFF